MSEMKRIARDLRVQQDSPLPATERRARILEILRREMDDVPIGELFGALAVLRRHVKPGDTSSEGGRLWECLRETERETPAADAPKGDDSARVEDLAKAVLGPKWKPGDTPPGEMFERLRKALELVFKKLNELDSQWRLVNVEWRRLLQGREATGDRTILDQKLNSIRNTLQEYIDTGKKEEQISKRVTELAASGLYVSEAQSRAMRDACGSIKKLLDPAKIQKKHGGGSWNAYKRIYKNDLYEFDNLFRESIVDPPFLKSYFEILRKRR